ncbi:MAG: hypothetical protein RJA81_935 [Planctomycetota bacterium]
MTGRSSAWLECTVRVREVGGSNPLAPTDIAVSLTSRCGGIYCLLALLTAFF